MADADTNGFDSLPKEWRVVRLADVSSLSSGGTPSKKRDDFWVGTIPWASPKDMKTPWLYDTQDHISQVGLEDGSRLVPAKSLFIVVRGMILAKDLPVSMAMVPMSFNQDMKAIHTTDQLDPEFLLHAFSAFKSHLIPEIGTSAHGTRRIGTQAIEEFRVPLPPIEEQRAIAAVLRTVLRAKETTEKVIAAARQLKQSLMQHLFTYGTVPFQEAEQVELQESESGTIPADWGTGSLSDILREPLRNGHSAKATNTDEGIRTLILTAVTKNDFCIENTKLTTADPERVRDMWLQSGDIFIERANTPELVGLAALYEGPSDFAIFPDLLIRVRVDETQMQARFLAYFLLTPTCRRYFTSNAKKTAGNFPKIDQGIIEKAPLPKPSLQVQAEIASALTRIDVKLKAERQRLLALDETFDSLLHELMTGQRRVRNLDKLEVL